MKARQAVLAVVCLAALVLGTGVASGQSTGSIVAWGRSYEGQCDVPPPNADFVAVAGGGHHSLGVKSDGTIVAWGLNNSGQCDVPAPNADFVAVAAGGIRVYFQVPPCTSVFGHSLGLKSDGAIVAWGYNGYGQCDVPAPNAGFVAVAAGPAHSLGLRSDGTIVAWGDLGSVPAPNADFVAVAAGGAAGEYSWVSHSLGLRSDGTVVAWGCNGCGQCDVPAPNADFVAVAGGGSHSLGLKSDGTIVAWGYNHKGECNVPAPNAHFVAIAACERHSLGLKFYGTIVTWGRNNEGQCDIPAPNTQFVAVAAGQWHSLGLKQIVTPVMATAFYAKLVDDDGSVSLRWSLPSCFGGAGLMIYRSLSEDGPYSCITPEPLPDAALGSYVDETAWPGGTFWYELRAVLASGEEVLATDMCPSITLPGTSVSGIRYVMPNPATAHTSIGYLLPEGWRSARLSVHDVAGRLVRRLDPATGTHGYTTVDWDGTASSGERVASGVYFVWLEVDGAVATQRMVLLR
jgi:hypothetical protein